MAPSSQTPYPHLMGRLWVAAFSIVWVPVLLVGYFLAFAFWEGLAEFCLGITAVTTGKFLFTLTWALLFSWRSVRLHADVRSLAQGKTGFARAARSWALLALIAVPVSAIIVLYERPAASTAEPAYWRIA
jgi:hypothetical protein